MFNLETWFQKIDFLIACFGPQLLVSGLEEEENNSIAVFVR
jgi:hypothetical protein